MVQGKMAKARHAGQDLYENRSPRLRMKHLPGALVLLSVLAAIPAGAQTSKPVTSPMLQNPDPADWLMWRRTLNSWGYSPLNQITRANVARLRMVWTRG